jgi:hypothetical protein
MKKYNPFPRRVKRVIGFFCQSPSTHPLVGVAFVLIGKLGIRV